MRSVALVLCLLAARASAQQPASPVRPDSARAESAPPLLTPPATPALPAAVAPNSLPPAPLPPQAPPAPPTPPPPPPMPTLEQLRFQQGLRTAGRGVAQLRDGLQRVGNAGRDSLRLSQASRRLSGLCGAARLFLASGRSRMTLAAYGDSTRVIAHQLLAQVDTLLRLAPLCQAAGSHQPDALVSSMAASLLAWDAALHDFRAATSVVPVVVPPPK